MRRYMHEYGVALEDFAGFSVNAHANATEQSAGHVPQPAQAGGFRRRADGGRSGQPVRRGPGRRRRGGGHRDQQRAGGRHGGPAGAYRRLGIATDAVALHDRRDLLWLRAAELSARKAMEAAGVTPDDIDVFELHDSYTIMAALSLEACGFAARGTGWQLARDGEIRRDGRIPISTFGGLKARGNPIGATGIYQIVELAQQLRGTAGDCQVPGATIGMAQNLGGTGATAVTHILKIDE
jgi:acetyl-CoA C-acetyltransferase